MEEGRGPDREAMKGPRPYLEHPPTVIGILSGEISRFSAFSESLVHLDKPQVHAFAWSKGSIIVDGMNDMVRQLPAIDEEFERVCGRKAEFLWILGDDHTFDRRALLDLLELDLDLVVPLCMQRNPPYLPVVCDEDGYTLDLPETGTHEIGIAGGAGMLVKRWVLDAIGDPWFEGPAEDHNFCRSARAVGAKLWCSTDVRFGHIAPHITYPHYDNGWQAAVQLDRAGETIIVLDAMTV